MSSLRQNVYVGFLPRIEGVHEGATIVYLRKSNVCDPGSYVRLDTFLLRSV